MLRTYHPMLSRRSRLLLVMLLVAMCFAPTRAHASEEANIDHVEPHRGTVNLLFSVPAVAAVEDPSVRVTIDGVQAEAVVELAAASSEQVRRTAVLAIDVSNSMRGERFDQAKVAARTFIESAPKDLYIGIVAFAGSVDALQSPTLDRAETLSVIETLSLSQETRLHDGILEALSTAGAEGQRSVLVLSDGRDTSDTRLSVVTTQIEESDVAVDVVALEQTGDALDALEQIAAAGDGVVLTADDPAALADLFSAEADALARQLLITATVPNGVTSAEASVQVSVQVDDAVYADTAFVSIRSEGASEERQSDTPAAAPGPRFDISSQLMLGGLVAAAAALFLLLLVASGFLDKKRTETLEERINAYSLERTARAAAGTPGVKLASAQGDGAKAAAIGMAQRALSGNKDLEAALAGRLEAAAVALKPAEWLLTHASFALASAFLAFLLGGGSLLLLLVGLLVGAFLPWMYLGFKQGRRKKAFNAQLADVLQLMSGSLSAGLSLAQSADTVVREGSDPVAGEFRRALIETRLGVSIEDALDSVAERMGSEDFHWVVMAIRIQREVGGNLAELLLTVAATLREREYLRRQVRALSAEGRMSAYILGGLPPAFLLYLTLINPEYLEPMFSQPLGFLMLGTMVVMVAVGAFWMSKLVKVEV